MTSTQRRKSKMASTLSSFIRKGSQFLTPNSSSLNLTSSPETNTFVKAPEGTLFPRVDPAVDGEDCDHDCQSCSVKYPAKWSIDEDEKLYGMVKGWSTHLIVATGKTDWVRDVADEKGSVMEAVGKCKIQPANGRLMLSASNIPVPYTSGTHQSGSEPTTVLLLPAFTIIENVTPQSVTDLITRYISPASTNTMPLSAASPSQMSFIATPEDSQPSTTNSSPPTELQTQLTPPPYLTTRPSPHRALILLCSQKTRDARCGQSAPLLRREFERHLRPLGLYRDLLDDRPGGVGIYFISHVGGHKFAANVMIYRRAGLGEGWWESSSGDKGKELNGMQEAGQCIWLARVRPEDCEGIVKFTVLSGKVVKPERQLRGGFDRGKGLVSW